MAGGRASVRPTTSALEAHDGAERPTGRNERSPYEPLSKVRGQVDALLQAPPEQFRANLFSRSRSAETGAKISGSRRG